VTIFSYSYDDEANLLGDYTDALKKTTKTLIVASKEAGLEVNVEKTNICTCFITRMQVKILT
jgi:hypothetical protein